MFLRSLPAPTCVMTDASTNWSLESLGGVTWGHFLWQKLPPCRGEWQGWGVSMPGGSRVTGRARGQMASAASASPSFTGPRPHRVLVAAANAPPPLCPAFPPARGSPQIMEGTGDGASTAPHPSNKNTEISLTLKGVHRVTHGRGLASMTSLSQIPRQLGNVQHYSPNIPRLCLWV